MGSAFLNVVDGEGINGLFHEVFRQLSSEVLA